MSAIGVLKLDEEVSAESMAFLQERWEVDASNEPKNVTNVLEYYCGVLANGVRVIHQLRGYVGLLLMPLDLVGNIVIMVFKLFLLNPPGANRFQTTIALEFALPLPSNDPGTGPNAVTTTPLDRIETNYSLHTQYNVRTNVETKFYAQPTPPPGATEPQYRIWWENISFGGWVPLPLLSGTYQIDDKKSTMTVVIPKWAFHPLVGMVTIRVDDDTIVACGKFRLWSVSRPMYRWILRNTFVPYLRQSLQDSQVTRVFVGGKSTGAGSLPQYGAIGE